MKHKRPIVGIPACIKMVGEHPFHSVGAKYINAILDVAECIPLVLPAIGDKQNINALLEFVDGILLTGSESNVAPKHYNKALDKSDMLMDPDRDATTLPLIKAAIDSGVPLLGICRGFQEVNVAYGGTLYQEVYAQTSMMNHQEKTGALEVRYGPAHPVNLTSGSFLQELLGGADTITVNSVHGQGIEKLGNNLSSEALAPDGLIEAIRVKDSKNFALAVQWHPEWKVTENAESMAIFRAFGDACKAYAISK